MTTKLVLADDHPIILEGLEQLFRRDKDFQVLATCTNGKETIAAVREHRDHLMLAEDSVCWGIDDVVWMHELLLRFCILFHNNTHLFSIRCTQICFRGRSRERRGGQQQ